MMGGRNAMPDRSGRGGGRGGRGAPEVRGRGATAIQAPGGQSTPRGFIVTITGYSPYKNISELLDPPKVQDDPNKWGLVTRLIHLNSMFDGNSPFELYKKTDKQHFDFQPGEVDLAAEMPPGIGVRKKIEGKDDVLIDPMTNEIISKITNADKTAQVNDSWFVLNFKLKWKDVNEPPSEAVAPPSTSRGAGQPAPPPSSSRKSQSPKGGGGGGRAGGEME
jgi:hypothetical protein